MSLTGYGPSPRTRLIFNGDDNKFELWLFKFRAYLRVQKLQCIFDDPGVENYDSTNALAYAELVQLLDDKSLCLIIRDAVDDCVKALDIFTIYPIGSSKPRIIAL